jgi:hypothetical protein
MPLRGRTSHDIFEWNPVLGLTNECFVANHKE